MGIAFAILFFIGFPPLRILVDLIFISHPIAVHRGFLTSPFLPHFFVTSFRFRFEPSAPGGIAGHSALVLYSKCAGDKSRPPAPWRYDSIPGRIKHAICLQ